MKIEVFKKINKGSGHKAQGIYFFALCLKPDNLVI
jgi:hypothetical protein